MAWYDVMFLVALGALIVAGFIYARRSGLTDRERAYRDEQRVRHRREMALTFSPGEKIWVVGFSLFWVGLIAYYWL